MTVQMRIAAIRLIETIQKHPKAAEAVDISSVIKEMPTKNRKEDGNH